MSIVTRGPMMSPGIEIGDARVPLARQLGAAGSDAFEDSATQQLLGIHELSAAKGDAEPAAPVSDPMGAPIPAYEEAPQQKPSANRIDMIDALDQVKKAGLDKTLKLPNEPDIAPAALQIMIDRARARAEHAATIARGPQGIVPDALMLGTSFLVGAVDPLNIAAAFVPVMGELRYAKLLASAGESAAARAGIRASVGAAQGVTGQALLEPIDWYAHSQDGRDFGMSDVLHNLVFGGLLGAGLHSGGGALSDAWRAHKGRPVYPYGPGEPLDRSAAAASPAEAAAAIAPDMDAVDRVLAGQTPSPLREAAPELAVLDDLPPRAKEDAARATIASLLDGTPVRSAELLDAAAQTDPRIAESFDLAKPAEPLTPQAARQAVADDIRQKLLDAELPPDQADANAAITAARYHARAARLGSGQNALELYRGEGIGVRASEGGTLATPEEAGRVLHQPRPLEPGLFADREAEGQASLPGAERIGQGELAQRRADAPLKPGVAQKPADEGLFGDSAAQKSFFQSQLGGPDIDWTAGGGSKTVKIGDTTVDYGVSRDGKSGEIILIETPKQARNQGSARRAMEAIINKADAEGTTLFLNSDPMREIGLTKPQLDKFYRSLGFVKNTGRNKDFTSRAEFVRQPQTKTFFQSQPQAPPFYSAVDRAIGAAGQDKATPEQWLGTLKNAAGVKAEEMKWLGLEDWLGEQQGSITKQQIQDYVRANAIEVKDVAKGEGVGGLTPKERMEFDDLRAFTEQSGQLLNEEQRARMNDLLSRADFEAGTTKYPSYTLPGGENYRELLLTLPNRGTDRLAEVSATLATEIGKIPGGFNATWRTRVAPEQARRVDALLREQEALQSGHEDRGFTSSHWDEPNVLAHVRFDDRISDGKKTLHLAEVQSDWHQAGKRRGYDTRPNLTEEARAALLAERDKIVADAIAAKQAIDLRYGAEFERRGLRNASREEKEAFWAPLHDELAKDPRQIRYDERINELNTALGEHQGGVPDAPFKTTWPELSMKRMIRYAAEHGYDRVSWDTGATNAERYDLSKQVQKIEAIKFSDGVWRLDGIDQHGQSFALANQVPAEKLADFVGKDLAERIVNDKRQTPNSVVSYSGIDLKVGGEGMAGFYDKILPATVNKLVKKFGAKVEQGAVGTSQDVHTSHFVGAEPNKMEMAQVFEAVHASPTDQRFVSPVTGERQGYQINRANNEMALREVRQAMNGGASFAEAMGLHGTHDLAEIFGGKIEVRNKVDEKSESVHALDLTPELRAAALEHGFPLFQGGGESPRGRITLSNNRAIIDLYKSADASTFLHESGHLWLDELMRDAGHAAAPAALRADRDAVLGWLGVKDASEIGVAQHERWAEGFEHYLASGEAPSSALAKAFAQFKDWLAEIYRALARTGQAISPEIKGVMDRLLATDPEIADRADELGASTRAVKPSGPRGRAATDPQTWSLFEYLASKGGLKADPELAAIFGGARGPFVGGFGPLLRREGLALDEALRVAKEGHYLFDAGDVTGAEAHLTPRDLLDMLDREGRGQRVYRMDHVSPDRAIGAEEDARHIVDALHTELQAGGGKAPEIDAKLEARVVEIVQHEGEHDVLAAYERAIMEDAERYEGLSDARRQDDATRHLPGWDAADAVAAPRAGATDHGRGRPAGLSAAGAGLEDGGEPRGAGPGDRAPGAPQLDSPRLAAGLRPQAPPSEEAWHSLARAVPEYDAPDAVRASQAADAAPEPVAAQATPSERVKAALAAEQTSIELYEARSAFLSPEERLRVDDVLRQINLEEADRREIFSRGAVCLAEAAGVVA